MYLAGAISEAVRQMSSAMVAVVVATDIPVDG